MSPNSAVIPLVVALGVVVSAADWPQWRGPFGTGVSPEKNLPTRWGASQNIAWKAPIAGAGVSSPVVAADLVFVTSQAGAGVRRAGNHPRLAQGEAETLGERALDVSRATGDTTGFIIEAFRRGDGRRAWEFRLAAEGPLAGVHDKHNLASPSPVTDGKMVYAWFGTGQLVALDLAGKVVWQRHLGQEFAPFEINWGHASSPALYRDLLILLCDHEPASYLLALDKHTGKERWKVDRGKGRASYSTPTVIESGGRAELIVNSNERLDAYDPATGEWLWHTGEANRFPIPVPAYHEGVVYTSRGYRSGPYLAIKPGGRGDITGTHVLWRVATGAPYVSSLVYADGLLYMANDAGVLTAADASNGERVWQERVGGVFSASPVAADGRVYFVAENGQTVVVKTGRPPTIAARNDIGERTLASPAISNGQIFLRSDAHVVAIGSTPSGSKP
jgi:outer membrane protein assembly factor BamB